VIFEREMTSPAAIARRKRTVVEFVLSYLQMPQAARPRAARLEPPRRRPARYVSRSHDPPRAPCGIAP
jgi:hypothetical protein